MVKTEGATRRVDFWARAQAKDSPSDGHGLGGEWKNLPPTSDWMPAEIVLDVPVETAHLQYGIGLAGPGKMWIDRTTIEIVGDAAPSEHGVRGAKNGAYSYTAVAPGWILSGSEPADYEARVDAENKHAGRSSGSLRSVASKPKGFGTLMQSSSAHAYLGKRVRLSAFLKTKDVASWAGLWLRVDGPNAQRGGPLAFDNMMDRPLKGTSDWARYEIVLDVPAEATALAFGALIDGSGQLWMDDLAFEVVDAKVPTTGNGVGAALSAPENLDFEKP
jgi:hypothetical protein